MPDKILTDNGSAPLYTPTYKIDDPPQSKIWLSSSPQTDTESWNETYPVRWEDVGDATHGYVANGLFSCVSQSGAVISKARFDATKQIILKGILRGRPNPGSSTDAYFGGLCIFDDQSNDTRYLELAVMRHLPPYMSDPNCKVVSLIDEVHSTLFGDTTPYIPHEFEINYSPGITFLVVDKVIRKTIEGYTFKNNPVVGIWCASVGEGIGDNGSKSHVQASSISITGTVV